MAGFVYFITDKTGAATNQTLIEAGLGYAILGAGPESRQCNGGPGGDGGLIVVADHPEEKRKPECGYLPAKQTWRKSPQGKFWVGFENDPQKRPAPEDLGRDSMYDGQAVTFDDGSVWIVPRCYGAMPKRRPTLPLKLDLNQEGQWVTAPVDRFAGLCNRAMGLWKKAIGADKEPTTLGESIDAALEAMAVNYRIGILEMAMIGWSSDDVTRVCRAMIDLDEIEKLARQMAEKKMDGATATSATI